MRVRKKQRVTKDDVIRVDLKLEEAEDMAYHLERVSSYCCTSTRCCTCGPVKDLARNIRDAR